MTSNARDLFVSLRDGGEPEINRLIADGEPESVWLDFKEKTTPDGRAKLSDSDRRNLSKALSGFANAVGGVLIWGVQDNASQNGSRVAFAPKPIQHVQDFVAQLQGLLPTAVTRSVEGVELTAVMCASDPSVGYVLLFVPESPCAPHRGELAEKRYFRRTGDNFVALEHYELEDMFGRRQRPALVAVPQIHRMTTGDQEPVVYRFGLSLRNEGRALAQFVGVDTALPLPLLDAASWDRHAGVNTASVAMRQDETPGAATIATMKHFSYRSRRDDPPVFPSEEIVIWPNLKRGGILTLAMTHDRFYALEEIGYRIAVNIYADGCLPTRVEIPFNDFFRF